MIPAEVSNLLTEHGLMVLEFDEGTTPTAESAARTIGVETGQIAKSLLFKGKSGSYYLFVCPGDKKTSSAKLKALAGEKVSLASFEETEKVTGYKPGGVCPFCLPNSTPVFLDQGLKIYDTIYPAAGTDSSGVPMTYEQLKNISKAKEADFCSDS